MLKRHQVLLTDWQIEHARFLSEKYDMSFSEAVRLLMSLAMIQTARELYPKFEPKTGIKTMVSLMTSAPEEKIRQELVHKYLSEVYFDARKASELRLSQDKKDARK